MGSSGAPSTALVITASATAAIVAVVVGELLRRVLAPPQRSPEELIALMMAAQAQAGRSAQPPPEVPPNSPHRRNSSELDADDSERSMRGVLRASSEGQLEEWAPAVKTRQRRVSWPDLHAAWAQRLAQLGCELWHWRRPVPAPLPRRPPWFAGRSTRRCWAPRCRISFRSRRSSSW